MFASFLNTQNDKHISMEEGECLLHKNPILYERGHRLSVPGWSEIWYYISYMAKFRKCGTLSQELEAL